MKEFIKAFKNRFTVILLIMTILNILTLRIFDAPLKNEVCKNGIVSFELAKDLDVAISILNSWDAKTKINAGLSLGFDFFFLLVYSAFIALLIFRINNRLWANKSFYKLGGFLVISIFIAAFFDIIENIALIKLLLGDLKQIWTSVAYYFAIMKFTIVLACVFCLLINWGILLFMKLNFKV